MYSTLQLQTGISVFIRTISYWSVSRLILESLDLASTQCFSGIMSSDRGYYDTIGSSRSPTGQHPSQQQHQTLHRVSSRHFETFASHGGGGGLYTPEDHAARFDPNRYGSARLDVSMSGGYGYEASGAQTWNPSSFGGPGALAAMGGATGRIKTPSRQRSALPAVSLGFAQWVKVLWAC